MRQLPRVLLLAGATVVVIIALAVSGLRLLMPHMNAWRAPIIARVSAAAGVPLQVSALNGQWKNFGPQLEIKDIQARLNDGGELKIQRVTLALDVWQSLLHLRWQFRDLTFWQLNLATNTPLTAGNDGHADLGEERLKNLFLRQFDHFYLRDSVVSFVTPSGQRAQLAMPELTWLNEKNRHRAEGLVSLSSLTGQHGVVQVRLDLRDINGYLDTGRVWLQADDVDVKPWLGQWMRDNTSFESARFSLAAWMSIQHGVVHDGDIWLKQGGANWLGDRQRHHLSVDNLTAHISRAGRGWQLNIPQTRVITDGQRWPDGQLALLWQPEGSRPGQDKQPELRVRAIDLSLAHLEPLVPLFAKLSPQLLESWRALRPRGQIQALAADIPLNQPALTRIQGQWHGLSWQHWKLLPAMENLSGSVAGSVANGHLMFAIHQATLPYGEMFRAPLEIGQASGILRWQHDAQGLTLSGQRLDVQARSLWAHGDFSYQQPQNQPPQLAILAGIQLTDAADAWRYFPEPLMGKSLTHYLSGAIKGGQVDNATLTFNGNPHQFPFRHNEGMFEVKVPLKQATYEFEPGWPALQKLNIDLDFINNGLWMNAAEAKLGEVQGRNISAVMPDYRREKLLIDGDISGGGPQVRDYFNQSPLKSSVGAALNELQIGGDVSGRLHLDIPLNGKQVRASGNVSLNNNTLLIKPLGTTFDQLSGQFTYDNGILQSNVMRARWFGQPVDVSFSTQEEANAFRIGAQLKASWQPAKMALAPKPLRQQLSGTLPWQSKVSITLPHGGGANYQVDIDGELNNVSSHLPAPLNKPAGQALPVKLAVSGDLRGFNLSGSVGNDQRFNSHWLPGKQLRIDRGIWQQNARGRPALPATQGMVLNLPPLDGEAWLGLLGSARGGQSGRSYLPGNIELHTPVLTLAGQRWQDLSATLSQDASGRMTVSAKGKEIAGSLTIGKSGPWAGHLQYLYYNPQWSGHQGRAAPPADSAAINFSRWPTLRLNCDECWLRGQNFGRMQAEIHPTGDTLRLVNGVIDSGSARLMVNGEWVNRPGEQRTSLKGVLSGKNISVAAGWFGVTSPLRGAPFNIDYDLHWRDAPWHPVENTLSGVMKLHIGAGQVADVSTGRTGQLLRLLSFDALLRKLRLDFNDTFRQGFYFDSINGTAWVENGVTHTDNLLVDGLEGDIALNGRLDLVQRQIDMEAVVTPEISTTVGVGVAFAVNPVVGAAVFAASKALGPLWNKISLLRYHISGPLDKPEINEVLRKPRETDSK